MTQRPITPVFAARLQLAQTIRDPEQAQRLIDQPRAAAIADLEHDLRTEGHCSRRAIARALSR